MYYIFLTCHSFKYNINRNLINNRLNSVEIFDLKIESDFTALVGQQSEVKGNL